MSSVRAVDRAVNILRSFSVDQPTLSALELQNRLRLSRATLHRLLKTLCETGLIEKAAEPERFRLAAGVIHFARTWLSTSRVADLARYPIEALRDKTGESAALLLLQDGDALCVLGFTSRHCLSICRRVGDVRPITHDAGGIAILAFLREPLRSEIVRSQTSNRGRRRLGRAIERTRLTGFSVDRDDALSGAVSIAAPIFDQDAVAIGSVALFVPSARLNSSMLDELGKKVLSTSRTISKHFGQTPPESQLAGPFTQA